MTVELQKSRGIIYPTHLCVSGTCNSLNIPLAHTMSERESKCTADMRDLSANFHTQAQQSRYPVERMQRERRGRAAQRVVGSP